jgi:hypothetical protein
LTWSLYKPYYRYIRYVLSIIGKYMNTQKVSRLFSIMVFVGLFLLVLQPGIVSVQAKTCIDPFTGASIPCPPKRAKSTTVQTSTPVPTTQQPPSNSATPTVSITPTLTDTLISSTTPSATSNAGAGGITPLPGNGLGKQTSIFPGLLGYLVPAVLLMIGSIFFIRKRKDGLPNDPMSPPGPPVIPGLDSMKPPGPPNIPGPDIIQPPGPPIKPGLNNILPPGPPTMPGLDNLRPPGLPNIPGFDSIRPPGPPIMPGLDNIKPPGPPAIPGLDTIKPPGPPVVPGLDNIHPLGPPTIPGSDKMGAQPHM